MTRVFVVLSALTAMGVPVRADDVRSRDGFRPLFNGKDLTGWTVANEKLEAKTATADGRFLVADGVIVAAEGKGVRALYTVEPFPTDFQLKLEFRASAKSDSGVYVRGPQLQVRDFIRRKEQMHLKDVFKDDGWNELDITVTSNTTVASVNGKPLSSKDLLELRYRDGRADVTLNGTSVPARDVQVFTGTVAVCKLNGVAFDPTYKPGEKGPIGLQAETGKFEFRNIRVRPIP